jgi:hypothetical protein
MRGLSATLAVIALLGSGAVMAQTAPPPQEPSSPPSTMGPSTDDPGTATAPSSSHSAPGSTSDKKAQMKDCMTQQRANNPQLSKSDAKKVCKAAVEGAPQS